jgi:hypothetical protein
MPKVMGNLDRPISRKGAKVAKSLSFTFFASLRELFLVEPE